MKNGKIAKCYFERNQTSEEITASSCYDENQMLAHQDFKHESLILAQDERWRRA